MVKKARKISKKWIEQTRDYFREFLNETDFPDPGRIGTRGPKFSYPEWLIMFVAVLSVKLKIKTYIQIHKMTVDYWDLIAKDLELKPISTSLGPLHLYLLEQLTILSAKSYKNKMLKLKVKSISIITATSKTNKPNSIPISSSGSNFYPRNTRCIPAVKILIFLELEQN